MSFLDKLRKEKMQSMREKDKLKTGVISLIMSGISLAEKEEKRELSDEEALTFVQRELKQARDTLDSIPNDRQDLIDETNRKIEIIEAYLPEQISEEDLEVEIEKIIEEENLEKSPKSKGILIKKTLDKFKGKTDGKIVNKLVSKLLS